MYKLAFLFGSLALAQPAFDLADIHPSQHATRGYQFNPGRLEVTSMTLLDLIKLAYSADDETITGGPTWLDIDSFDIHAKAARGASEETMHRMLQRLLADRFQLVLHTANAPLPVFALLASKKPLIKRSSDDAESVCHPRNDQGQFVVACRNTTMEVLAARIRPWAPMSALNHPVFDMTGLKGGYDFTLRVGGSDDNFVSIFDAVEKQLGLRLEVRTQPAPVIAIDSVNRTPTPNPPGVAEKAPTEFEAASIRPSEPGAKRDWVQTPGGRLDIRGLTLKELIESAYDNLADERISGGPKWVDTDRFTIVAKAPPDAPVNALLKSLLIERFQLRTHFEDQPLAVYALTAKKPKLDAAAGTERSTCKITRANDLRTYACTNVTMSQFADRLILYPRPVVDATGLTGSYNFTLSWTPGEPQEGRFTVFEAIERQLGLKLESQKRPLPVLMIDHAALPSN